MNSKPYNDDTIMEFGMHKNKKLCDVPDSYFLFLYNEGKLYGKLKAYVLENLDAIKENCKNGK